MTVNRSTRWVGLLAVGLATLSAWGLTGPGIVTVNATMMTQRSPDEKADTPRASSNPVSGKPEAIDAGRKLYGMWCMQCHGPAADGESRFGKYAGDLRVFWRGYREFVVIVKEGRTQKQMPPWKEVLDDAKIAQIGAYLETLALDGANWK
jgi:mono/diheme cytochrome c family protein